MRFERAAALFPPSSSSPSSPNCDLFAEHMEIEPKGFLAKSGERKALNKPEILEHHIINGDFAIVDTPQSGSINIAKRITICLAHQSTQRVCSQLFVSRAAFDDVNGP